MKSIVRVFLLLIVSGALSSAHGQSIDELRESLSALARESAVTGHEQALAASIADRLKRQGLDAQVDVMSNVTVTLGSGKPHRMLVANLDEPGYIVSAITDDGYLRMQRIGTARTFPYFDQYFEGQRLTIRIADGRTVSGVLSIPSTHLARDVNRVERPFDLSDAYIDIGARSASEAAQAGVKILDPVSIEKGVSNLSQDHLSGPFISDRMGAAVLLSILATTPAAQVNGTVTFAFTTQEHFGRKGLDRMTVAFAPDEVYVLEPMNPVVPQDAAVSVDVDASAAVRRMIEKFEGMRAAAMQPDSQKPAWKSGTQVVRVGIPVRFHRTPVEVVDLKSLRDTVRFLKAIVQMGVS